VEIACALISAALLLPLLLVNLLLSLSSLANQLQFEAAAIKELFAD
jgi:hypothetical protein